MNREWHKQNKMPHSPTVTQRIAWHLEHAAKCQCRGIPQGLLAEIAKRGLTRHVNQKPASGERPVRRRPALDARRIEPC